MIDSSANRTDQIEQWFRTHDDGDFSVLPPDHPSLQIGNFANARTIVYTTRIFVYAFLAQALAYATNENGTCDHIRKYNANTLKTTFVYAICCEQVREIS